MAFAHRRCFFSVGRSLSAASCCFASDVARMARMSRRPSGQHEAPPSGNTWLWQKARYCINEAPRRPRACRGGEQGGGRCCLIKPATGREKHLCCFLTTYLVHGQGHLQRPAGRGCHARLCPVNPAGWGRWQPRQPGSRGMDISQDTDPNYDECRNNEQQKNPGSKDDMRSASPDQYAPHTYLAPISTHPTPTWP